LDVETFNGDSRRAAKKEGGFAMWRRRFDDVDGLKVRCVGKGFKRRFWCVSGEPMAKRVHGEAKFHGDRRKRVPLGLASAAINKSAET
jgi:hypothetical protein